MEIITGTLENGTETAVSSSAVQILAANGDRSSVIIQNVGANNVRVGKTGVTATTGIRLEPGQTLVFDSPVPVNAIYAIRESADSTVFATEVL